MLNVICQEFTDFVLEGDCMKLELMKHQETVMQQIKEFDNVGLFLDMGLGKTFVGSEKLKEYGTSENMLLCQKPLIKQWIDHFKRYYPEIEIVDGTKVDLGVSMKIDELQAKKKKFILIMNYDLIFRRKFVTKLKDFTLLCDESSMLQNETAKRTRMVLYLKKLGNLKHCLLLSGTPVSGKYEHLWAQCQLLNWDISKREFYDKYICQKEIAVKSCPFPVKIITGYKNVDDLKEQLRKHGSVFMKTEEVLTLPEQTDIMIECDNIPDYKKFMKNNIIMTEDGEKVADTTLTKMLYARQLVSQYNKNKLEQIKAIFEGTEDRLIVFYNFTRELEKLVDIAKKLDKPISIVNGQKRDLNAYENDSNSVTFIQYQAGAMGLNLQKSNKIIYFSLPLSSELFEQSKKRIHRIGQKNNCFYYYLMTTGSIDYNIWHTLKERKDYTDELFKMDFVG